MNSIIEVSPNIIALIGSVGVSEFRLNQLIQTINSEEITDISCREIYFCEFNDCLSKFTENEISRLSNLLNANENIYDLEESFFFITPRIGTISPWSSKATDIAKNCGLSSVKRIERGTYYYFNKKLDTEILQDLGNLLVDKMTQEVVYSLNDINKFFSNLKPGLSKEIDIFTNQEASLKEANIELGLALSEDEIMYLYESYIKTNKNPTDAELMMFAQANSEHCRHKIFNADWAVDGKTQPNSLFDMIRNTHKNNANGVISAYEDNAAILNGHVSNRFYPQDGKYSSHEEEVNLVIKVETHNHPTAISPFSGASTGSGGEIRDEGATGIGAKPKAGLTGFSVSNLRIPKLIEDWEFDEELPQRIASPLKIMIDAPVGAASFNNEFGRPNVLGYFRSFEEKDNDIHYGYHKPIMLAGGLGNIKKDHVFKKDVPIGSKLIVLGGPAMLIGLGGGSASSLASGEGDGDLDFASVQRENPEMERRCQEVLDRCWQEQNNPILFIHDVGAGGLSNAIPELVKDSGHGGLINLRDIPNSEPGMTPMEIWCNESQERYVMAVSEDNINNFEEICNRERCPFSIVGEITKGNNLEVYDSFFDNYPISLSLEILFGKPPKTYMAFDRQEKLSSKINLPKKIHKDLVYSVLRHPTVASKSFLITIGDRSITGLVARDQLVGPWQVPVSDYALTKSSFSGYTGEAMAIGERTPLAVLNAKAAAKMSVGEVVTNILPSGIGNISDIKLSANWMGAPGKLRGDQDLYEAVEAIGMDLCPEWNITIPVGKDSLSMSTEWVDDTKDKSVISPLSLVVTGFSPIQNTSIAITPELKNEINSSLLFIDLGKGSTRMGGSILAQINNEIGGISPDVECIEEMPNFVLAFYGLLKENKILAYHDRSDGGLITTLAEMSFSSRLGLNINLDSLIQEEEKVIEQIFNEELGAVIQVSNDDLNEVLTTLESSGLAGHLHNIGSISSEEKINLLLDDQQLLSLSIEDLLKNWFQVSFEIQSLRDNPETAKAEYDHDTNLQNLGLKSVLPFLIPERINIKSSRPRIAILREQGVNGQNEMAAAFNEVGFDCIDVHMTDLLSNKQKLDDFEGLVACGGFSYGDVLGAGGGWANSILFNKHLRNQFGDFFHNENVFSLGVCNGCQTLSLLSSLIPGSDGWPTFKRNYSEKFESRLIQVKVKDSPSIFFRDMEGAIIPVPVAHGEGKIEISEGSLDDFSRLNLNSISYTDDKGIETDLYPHNPNGSPFGIAGLTNQSGTVTVMMPHPERAFLTDQLSWHPEEWKNYSPWIKFFLNAREFID